MGVLGAKGLRAFGFLGVVWRVSMALSMVFFNTIAALMILLMLLLWWL